MTIQQLPHLSPGQLLTRQRAYLEADSSTSLQGAPDRYEPQTTSDFSQQMMALRSFSRSQPASNTQFVSAPAPNTQPTSSNPEKALSVLRSELSTSWLDWSVSDRNALNAHNAIKATSWDDFNPVLQGMAKENSGHLLNTYLKELQEADPSKVQEFSQWLAQGMDPESARQILRSTDSESWGILMGSLEGLDPKERQQFVQAFGGQRRIEAKSWYERLRGEHAKSQAVADGIASGMKAINTGTSLRPSLGGTLYNMLLDPRSNMMGVYADAMSKTPRAFIQALQNNITSRHTTAADSQFVGFLEGSGIPANQGLNLLRELKSIYND